METTRKTIRNLLAVSVLGIVIAKVGLVPSRISAFGIEFNQTNQESLLSLLALAILYFIVVFLVYVSSELVAWQLAFHSESLKRLKEGVEKTSEIDSDREMWFHRRARTTYIVARPTFYLRIFVELIIPIALAIYSANALWNVELPEQEKVNWESCI